MADVFVVAEVGSVHDGSVGNAHKLIETAAEVGADAVKFQTHLPEAESLASAPSPPFFDGEPRMDYFRRTGFSREQWRDLKAAAEELGLTFVSSAFSLEALELLEGLDVRMHKVASGEVSNLPLLERMAETGKPVLLSSGMSAWSELDQAVEVLRSGGPVTVMQCSSLYPCPPERVGLNIIRQLSERYDCAVGFSDHTLGPAAAIAAVTLGATVVEKHLTFSRRMYGSDAPHSMEPYEFRAMVDQIREVSRMLASPVDKDDLGDYEKMKTVFEKSIVSSQPLPAGTRLERRHLAFKKPGDGIPAAAYEDLLGKVVAKDLPADHQLQRGDLQ